MPAGEIFLKKQSTQLWIALKILLACLFCVEHCISMIETAFQEGTQ